MKITLVAFTIALVALLIENVRLTKKNKELRKELEISRQAKWDCLKQALN